MIYAFNSVLQSCWKLDSCSLRAGVHYGPWRWPFSMVRLDCPTSMVRFLKNKFLKPLGLTLGVLNQMWNKKNCYAPKSECADFFLIYVQKGHFEKKIQVWPFSCLLLGFTCLHFLLSFSKMWLPNLLTTILTR